MAVFASQMARIRPAKVTVFATPNDRALSLSSLIASSRQRVGAIDASKPEDRAEIESLGAIVVDITAYADADRFISHAVYADLPQVMSEIGGQIEKPRAEDATYGVGDRRQQICRSERRAGSAHRSAGVGCRDGRPDYAACAAG